MMTQSPNNIPYRELPTTSLYLQDSLNGEGLWSDWEKCRTGPSSFCFGDRLVIVRYANDGEVELARTIKSSGGSVLYLIDDDLQAIVDDSLLPDEYRGKIGEFISGPWKHLKELIDEVVVSSAALKDKMQRMGFNAVSQLDPMWQIPSDEIPEPVKKVAPLEIAWLCSRSHLADLESISVELAKFQLRHRDIRLTVLLGKNQPKWIKNLRHVENIKPLAWPEYQLWLKSRRFDLALYPLIDTEVNQSRSINKVLEHAVAGAASIISASAPFASRLRVGDCLFSEPGEWGDNLEMLMADRNRISDMANQSRKHAQILSDEARVRQVEFWKKRLPVINTDNYAPSVRV